MNCPQCSEPDARALETRVRPDNAVRRRRECLACGYRWSTLERTYAKLPSPHKGVNTAPKRQGKRKLTDEQVLRIFYANMEATTLKELAEANGVSREAVRQIRAGQIYAKVVERSGGLRLCSNCSHWAATGFYCTMGFPDPDTEGCTFATDCSLYAARTQSTSLA